MPTWLTSLMPHQQAAVDKLSRLRVGALYMDMGTGKTRTALELALRRIGEGKADTILWLCPVGVRSTIAAEVAKHASDVPWELARPRCRPGPSTVVIAGIESLSGSISLNARLLELVQERRCFLVVDESNLVKSPRADRTLAVWRLAERCPYRVVLNGTPLSNNIADLFSQWYLLDWRILGYTSFYSFAANHLEYDPERPGRIIRAHRVDYLVRKMAPYLYQVRKSDCLSLPPKSYSWRTCSMSWEQACEYERAKDAILMEPDAYDLSPSIAIYKLFTALQRVVSGLSHTGAPLWEGPEGNPRIQALLETVAGIPDDAKVLVWCKYTHEIESVRVALRTHHGPECVAEVWGGIPQRRRADELESFQGPARFLVANRECAAYGLNLQHCHYAVYYSNTFAWASRSQSEDRLHRQGQTHNVHIIDVVCEGSIDERIQRCLSRKERLVESFRREIASQRHTRDSLGRWLDGADGTASGDGRAQRVRDYRRQAA